MQDDDAMGAIEYKGLYPLDLQWERDRLLLHCRLFFVEEKGYSDSVDQEIDMIRKEFEKLGMGKGYLEKQV